MNKNKRDKNYASISAEKTYKVSKTL